MTDNTWDNWTDLWNWILSVSRKRMWDYKPIEIKPAVDTYTINSLEKLLGESYFHKAIQKWQQKRKTGLTKITITFSKPLNGYNTGIDFGPLGEEAIPKIGRERVWSKDASAWTFEADLKPNMHYQILISNNFRTKEGTRLKPYLIDISTTE